MYGLRLKHPREKPYICLVMKTYSFLLLLLLLSMQAAAQPLRESEARQVAGDFLSAVRGSEAVLRPVTTTEAQPFYAFDISGGGFVIAGGDERAVPVLAYVPEGQYDADSLPPAMQTWLSLYARELEWADSVGYTTTTAATTTARTDISYLVPTQWSQGSPYYNRCVFSQNYCYTGCVATAMAQIMYYWATTGGYPHGSTAIDSYTTSTNRYSVGALEAIDAFDWETMLTTYSSSSSDAAKSAVAELMRYCGQAVQMDYSTSGSGASAVDIAPALRNYFGYDSGTHYSQRQSTTTALWDSLIYAEISAGRPVLMTGVDGDEFAGHAFVCDGYQAATGLYHFNWGWSGAYDGFFALEALQPGGTGTGGTSSDLGTYNIARSAIVGIQPSTGEEHTTQSYDLLSTECLYLTGGSSFTRTDRTDDIDPLTLLAVLLNYTGETITASYDFALFSADGEMLRRFDCGETNVLPANYGYITGVSLSLGAQLPYGTYYIRPVARMSGESQWIATDGSNHHYLRLLVDEEAITVEPSFSLSATISSLSDALTGTYDNTLYLQNTGAEELSTTFVLQANGSTIQYLESYAAPGETDTLALSYTGSTTHGTDVVLTDRYGTVLPFVADTTYADICWDFRFDGYIDASNRLYSDTYSGQLIVSNKGSRSYDHTATLYLYPTSATVSDADVRTISISLPAHSAAAYDFCFDSIETDIAHQLRLTLYEETAEATYLMSDYGWSFTPTRGIVTDTPDGLTYTPDSKTLSISSEARFADLRYTDNTGSISPNDNPATLYILPAGAPNVLALSGKNVVKGSTASTLTLSDDTSLRTPVDFTATTATYERTFTYAGIYETFVLPFDAAVPAGLTVESLSERTGDTLVFSPVQSIEAYTPYLAAATADGQTFTFSGSQAHIPADTLAITRLTDIDFLATTAADSILFAHTLSDDGTAFTLTGTQADIDAYRAYIIDYAATGNTFYVKNLTADGTDAIVSLSADNSASTDSRIFSLQGVCMGTNLSRLPAGIYIQAGRKVRVR